MAVTETQAKGFLGMDRAQFNRALAWLDAEENRKGSTADDLAAYCREELVDKVTAKEQSIAQDRIPRPEF